MDDSDSGRSQADLVAPPGLDPETVARFAGRLFSTLPGSGLFIVDRALRFVWVDGSLTTASGWTRERLLGRTVDEVLEGDPRLARVRESYERALAGEATSHESRWGERFVWVQYIPLPSDDGGIDGAAAVCIDLAGTMRDHRLHALNQHVSDVLWILDLDQGVFRHVSPSVERLRGFTVDEVLAQSLEDAMTPASLAHVRADIAARLAGFLAGGPAVFIDEVEQWCKDGSTVWTETTTRYTTNPENGHVEVYGTSRDISERKRAESELARERRRLEHALEATQLGTWEGDLRAGVTRFDARARAQYDMPDEVVSTAEALSHVHPADRGRLASAIARDTAPGGSGRGWLEFRVVHRNGAERILSVHVHVEFEGQGPARVPVRMFGTSQDVTEQRLAERRAQQQHLLLREAGEIALFGGWEFDPATGKGSWTEETARIHGVADTEATAGDGLERFEGEARARIEAALAAAITDGTPYDLELPFTAVDGVRKWVRAVCHPLVEDGRVVRVRGAMQDITERKLAERALQRFVSGSPALIYALAVEPKDLRLIWTGGDIERLVGWTAEEAAVRGWWHDNIHPDDRQRVLASSPTPYEIEHQALDFRFRKKDGRYVWIRDERRLLRDEHGRATEVVGSWVDVTERVALEQQLRQSQKLEAIGQLAGGVAHDFNNLLTVIAGNSEMLAAALVGHDDELSMIGEVRDASHRAAALTRQLLAFSRAQVLTPEVIDVNDAVAHVERMLRRLLGEHIALESRPGDAGRIRVDVGQFEQVLVNLAVNARDAMPDGGVMTIATETSDLDDGYTRAHPDVRPGRYARVTVSDTGAGMAPEVRTRVFEPFFTTKEAGRGTGLGLATVFGIVKQSGGHIEVYSEPGAGTVFTVYFPQVDVTGRPAMVVPPDEAARGTETVLLVEDEQAVRRLAVTALAGHGYTELDASNGAAALAIAAVRRDIALLVTDLVLPGMSGTEIARTLRERHPGLRVLFMSGYVHDALVRHGLADGREAFIHKPFSITALLRAVRDTLDAEERGRGA